MVIRSLENMTYEEMLRELALLSLKRRWQREESHRCLYLMQRHREDRASLFLKVHSGEIGVN